MIDFIFIDNGHFPYYRMMVNGQFVSSEFDFVIGLASHSSYICYVNGVKEKFNSSEDARDWMIEEYFKYNKLSGITSFLKEFCKKWKKVYE